MTLQKHEIWDFFPTAISFDSFQSNLLKPIFFKPNVSEDIKLQVSVIEKLLIHSYYEYDFIDLALNQSIIILEKAMRIRYREINNKSSKKLTLAKLIDWFFDNNYFEIKNIEVLNQLRSIRNNKVHNEERSSGGIMFLKKVYNTLDLINDIYEDRDLRILRNKETDDLQQKIDEIFKEGVIIKLGVNKIISFRAIIIFFNNKLIPQKACIFFWPIFAATDYPKYEAKRLKVFKLEFSNWNITSDGLFATDSNSGENVEIVKIDNEINKAKFQQWKTDISKINDIELILMPDIIQMNKYFFQCLQEFHQIN